MTELTFLINIIVLLLTLFVVLTERKFLAYAQRRMGPVIMGRNGYFQIILDLIKLVTKETFFIPKPSIVIAPFFLAILFATQLSFSQIFIFNNNLFLFTSLDSLLIYYLILLLISNAFFLLMGIISNSRYALISTIRSLVHVISLDIFLTLIYSWLIFLIQSPNFNEFSLYQNPINLVFLYFPIAFIFILILLLESKRAPFDHAETESEVVAGYAVEYGGGMLLIFYLAEYLHLVIASVQFVIFFFGGWNLFFVINLLIIPFFLMNDFSFWTLILF